jgi:predicted nucleotidyltransferase
VFRLDREACLARLREKATELLDREADVLEVRLVGSLARGDALPGSDADLLIVLDETEEPFLARIDRLQRHLAGVGLGCDVFPYTTSELDGLRREGNALVRAAEREGILLARR